MRAAMLRFSLVALLAASSLSTTPAAQTPAGHGGDRLDTLQPGEFVVQKQTVPVDVVFIGYRPGQVNDSALQALLPAAYKPIVRYPQFYGLNGRDIGLDFRFKYRVVHQTRDFESRFFSFLTKIGTEGPLTAFQTQYNDQEKNVLDVAGPVLYIDAPQVERYLASHDGGDSRHYTIYFINWYGRSDFRFHVYTKTDEVDPEIGRAHV